MIVSSWLQLLDYAAEAVPAAAVEADADPQIFGIWERVPLVNAGQATLRVRAVLRARAQVAVPASVTSTVRFSLGAMGQTSRGVEGGSVAFVGNVQPYQSAAANTMPYNEFEDWIILMWGERR